MEDQWIVLCRNLRTQFLGHFLDIQDCLDELYHQLEDRDMIDKLVQSILDLLVQIVNIINSDSQHMVEGFRKSLNLFVQVDINDKVHQYELLGLAQNLYSKLAMSHFQQDEEQLELPPSKVPYPDGTSTCSDFSDDNFEVEDFEASVAMELFQQIRTQLLDEEIVESCQYFKFTIYDRILNIQEFFEDALKLQHKSYDIVIFLNYTGLLRRMLEYKQDNQFEYFVMQLHAVLHKIKYDNIGELVDSNCFELKYSRLSQRKFLRCTILSDLYTKIVQEKLDRWKQTQDVQEVMGENLKQLRRFILDNKAPLSRWEVSILSIQDVELNSIDLVNKLQNLVMALELDYEQLLDNFMVLDKLYVNLTQFTKWVKNSCIPLTPNEIRSLFYQVGQPYGYYTVNGVKLVYHCDYYMFLNKLFGLQQQIPEHKQQFKYNDEITLQQYNKHILLKVSDLQQQLNQMIQYQETVRQSSDTDTSSINHNDSIPSNTDNNRLEIQYQNQIIKLESEQQQQLKIMDTKHKTKIRQLLYELENKDKQMEQYRMQLESLIRELEWVKTERDT